jgi:hypothetical protein
MSRTIYLRDADGNLIKMHETLYKQEVLFHRLLEEAAELLPGEQINPDAPRRWLLVAREVAVPGTGAGGHLSLDHLFLDQDGVPTFVEVKRSSDTRLRREVVGQMLDYAANATVYWPVGFIREQFYEWCDIHNLDAAEQLDAVLEGEMTEERYWEIVHTNLLAGKVRLLFVADIIPPELQRIIEFLNERMDPTEVLGVEIRRYVGGGMETFIPSVVGWTGEAQATKSAGPSRQWDEESFFADLAARQGEADVWVAQQLLDWAHRQKLAIWWGRGKVTGSAVPRLFQNGEKHFTFVLWSSGYIGLYFQPMSTRTPFGPQERRQELMDRLNAVEGVAIPADGVDRQPSIEMAVLADENRLREFTAVWDWYLDEVRRYGE